MKKPTLDELWATAPSGEECFGPNHLEGLPEFAKRYLTHAIAPGTKLAKAVRLKMHGEIKLKSWLPFKAEQVIRLDRGLLWEASVKMMGLPMSGYDLLLNGEGAMRWKYVGLFPIVSASGPDISKSAMGRLRAECSWLPSAFCVDGAHWMDAPPSVTTVSFPLLGDTDELSLCVGENGNVQNLKMMRWGNADGGEFQPMDFGGIVEEEATFGGYTIPSKLRIGWHYGLERMDWEGEFIRVQVDHAEFK